MHADLLTADDERWGWRDRCLGADCHDSVVAIDKRIDTQADTLCMYDAPLGSPKKAKPPILWLSCGLVVMTSALVKVFQQNTSYSANTQGRCAVQCQIVLARLPYARTG